MLGFFKKKNQQTASENQYAGVAFGPFVINVPQDWACVNDNGTLRAHKNDVVRLSISIRDMSNSADYTPDELFATVKAGYFDSDINWGAYSAVIKKGDIIYQTLEYIDEPRLAIAVVGKVVANKNLALIASFAGNSGKDLEAYFDTFISILETIEVM